MWASSPAMVGWVRAGSEGAYASGVGRVNRGPKVFQSAGHWEAIIVVNEGTPGRARLMDQGLLWASATSSAIVPAVVLPSHA